MFSMDLLIFFLQLVFIILSHDYVTDIDASDLDPDTTPQTLFDQEDESTPQPPPTLPPDPYARPIFKLNYKSFYKRVTDWSAAMSSSFRTRPSTEVPSTLTDRGRSNRARMQRRGDPVGRAEDIEEEENTIGLNTSSRGAPSSNEPG